LLFAAGSKEPQFLELLCGQRNQEFQENRAISEALIKCVKDDKDSASDWKFPNHLGENIPKSFEVGASNSIALLARLVQDIKKDFQRCICDELINEVSCYRCGR
jgi:hypothetical protein